MKPRPVYNTKNKNKLPQRSPGKCKSHTLSNTDKQQQCVKIYWESRLSNNSSLLTNKVCISGCYKERTGEGQKVLVKEKERGKRGNQKVRAGVKVELSSKQRQIPPAQPHSQVNRAPVLTKTMF